MYYDGLREGLRAATKVVLDIYARDETQEIVFEINRYGNMLWRMKVARVAMVERDEQLAWQHKAYAQGDEIVTAILGEVDWDTFFPLEFAKEVFDRNREALIQELYENGLVSLRERGIDD